MKDLIVQAQPVRSRLMTGHRELCSQCPDLQNAARATHRKLRHVGESFVLASDGSSYYADLTTARLARGRAYQLARSKVIFLKRPSVLC